MSEQDANSEKTAGRIDLHSHLLPGIDDGCQTLDESLACIQSLVAHGYRGTVCTPHILSSIYPNNTVRNVRADVDELSAALKERGIDYQLWPGGEVRISDDAIDWLSEIGVPTLGDSRYVLIDYFGRSWPVCGDELCDYLFEQGLQPLLAHPERMLIRPMEWFRTLDRLQERGVLLQGNLNSLTGLEGPQAQEVGMELLKQDRYFVLAMDMHGVDSLPTRFRGLQIAETLIGLERLTLLTEERPNAILTIR